MDREEPEMHHTHYSHDLKYIILKVEDKSFRLTGIDVKQLNEGVEISMNDYADSLEEIEVREDKSEGIKTNSNNVNLIKS